MSVGGDPVPVSRVGVRCQREVTRYRSVGSVYGVVSSAAYGPGPRAPSHHKTHRHAARLPCTGGRLFCIYSVTHRLFELRRRAAGTYDSGPIYVPLRRGQIGAGSLRPRHTV